MQKCFWPSTKYIRRVKIRDLFAPAEKSTETNIALPFIYIYIYIYIGTKKEKNKVNFLRQVQVCMVTDVYLREAVCVWL